MGKRSAVVELFLGDMGSIQWETRPSMQREDQLTMETRLEQIAAKARCEPKLRFTSLAHHITRDRVQRNLLKIPNRSAAGVDGQTAEAAKKGFGGWIGPMLQSIHRQGYQRAGLFGASISRSPVRRRNVLSGCRPYRTGRSSAAQPRCYLPSTSRTSCPVRSAAGQGSAPIMPCRPSMRSSPAARSGWVLEADLKNFFGSLSHEWMLRFVEHRVGDPRLISLIRRWLKAGVMEDGAVHPSDEGTPQGGSISVLLSNLYLHYVLDLWFERIVKVRLQWRSPAGALHR